MKIFPTYLYPSDGTSCIKQCARNYDVDESENACVECKKGKNDERGHHTPANNNTMDVIKR